jgi:hypothetical protein
MKKAFVWALMATLAVAGSAFAVPSKVTANATFPSGAPTTTNNDDSCDISVAPAATLLLPYFEVDMSAAPGVGDTTSFTVTNVSQYPAIAHVTIWTDWSFPVLDFNIFLTGYDVQSINLYDIIVRGVIAGTSSDSDVGARSLDTDVSASGADLDLTNCNRLATRVGSLLPALQSALVDGVYPGCNTVGTNQPDGRARGYITIDVANECSTSLPTDAGYFTSEILFDNVLVGDYQQIDPANNFAQGGPMVHIRAIPEGGEPGALFTNFDRTFYSRYQAQTGTADRRQPLPSTFAARWISGGAGSFNTSYKIWREGTTNEAATCAAYRGNGQIAITELVRFDEDENPETFAPDDIISPAPTGEVVLPETSKVDVADDSIFPVADDGDVAGWMYLNLDNGFAGDGGAASQNWVIVSMEAEGRFSVDFDAAWLGNGCSAPALQTDEDGDDPAIGPADNVTPGDGVVGDPVV